MLYQTKAKVTLEMTLLVQAADADEALDHFAIKLDSAVDCVIVSLNDDDIAVCLAVEPYTEVAECTDIAKVELDPPVESSLDPEQYGFDIEDECEDDDDDEDDDAEADTEEATITQDNKPKT